MLLTTRLVASLESPAPSDSTLAQLQDTVNDSHRELLSRWG